MHALMAYISFWNTLVWSVQHNAVQFQGNCLVGRQIDIDIWDATSKVLSLMRLSTNFSIV